MLSSSPSQEATWVPSHVTSNEGGHGNLVSSGLCPERKKARVSSFHGKGCTQETLWVVACVWVPLKRLAKGEHQPRRFWSPIKTSAPRRPPAKWLGVRSLHQNLLLLWDLGGETEALPLKGPEGPKAELHPLKHSVHHER